MQVSDGATTVIGGIFVSREQASEDKTPVLHKVPLLGWFVVTPILLLIGLGAGIIALVRRKGSAAPHETFG